MQPKAASNFLCLFESSYPVKRSAHTIFPLSQLVCAFNLVEQVT